MLLSRHADRRDIEALAAYRARDRRAQRLDPGGGILLARAVVAFRQRMWRATDGEDFTGLRIAQHDLCRLGTAVHTKKDASHCLR